MGKALLMQSVLISRASGTAGPSNNEALETLVL
jgi:hypothetical protein